MSRKNGALQLFYKDIKNWIFLRLMDFFEVF